MKKDKDYIKDIAEIRSMMERSSKFLSLSGWAGIMAGIYAIVGAYIAYAYFKFKPIEVIHSDLTKATSENIQIIILAIIILILSVGTAIFLSFKKSIKKEEKAWNSTSKRLIKNISIPLLTGGLLILIFLFKGYINLIAPLSLVFYGLALYSAGNFTYNEIKFLGIIKIILGILSFCFIKYSILLWAIGFGLFHIIYGIYIYIKHER